MLMWQYCLLVLEVIMSLGSFLGVEKGARSLLYRIYTIFFVSGMVTTLLGAILPALSSEYELSYSVSGTLLSAHQIGNLISVFAAGVLPYAIGRRLSTTIMVSGIVLGLLLMTITGNPFLLFVAFALTGIGRGTLSNITNVVVGESAEKKTAGLNFLHAAFAVGAFLSPFIVIATVSFGWRTAPLAIAFLMLCAIIAVAMRLPGTRSQRIKGDGGIPRSLGFWINTFIMFFYLCAEGSLTGWLVTYFQDEGIFPAAVATAMQSFLWIMILLGRLACAMISTKVNKSGLILTLGLLMTGFFILMISVSSPVVIFIALLGVGISMSGIYPTTLSSMDTRYNSSTLATGTCIGTATIGAIAMPIIIGHVAERTGLAGGIATISVALVLMVTLMIIKLIRASRGKI